LREEHRVKAFENVMLRKIFWPKRDEETGGLRGLHEELHDVYSSTNIMRLQIQKDEMGGACGTYGGEEGIIQDLVGKPEGKRPLGRARHTWDYNTEMNL
jgi:hypothetical protein